jgi:hypothetical protein
MTRNLPVTIPQICTIKLALIGWGTRCDSEAARMDKWAGEYDEKGDAESAAKCRANAIASRGLKADAEALLAVIR